MDKEEKSRSERKKVENPRWDNWHVRLPNPKDQQKAIDLFHKSGGRNEVGFRACSYTWREFQGDYGG